MTGSILWNRLRDNKVFWPLAALALIMLFNLFFTPGFFKLEIKDGHLFGSLIDVVNRGAPLMLLGIGMTMVIATAGVDLSVGAVIAISAATAAVLINPALAKQLISSDKLVQDVTFTPLWLLILIALGVSTLCGLWNGLLVSRANIQPMVHARTHGGRQRYRPVDHQWPNHHHLLLPLFFHWEWLSVWPAFHALHCSGRFSVRLADDQKNGYRFVR